MDDIVIVTGGGGCPYVTSTSQPHLGGNFDGGDVGTQYPKTLWPWLIKTFHPNLVVDVGCGTGEAAHAFAELGCRVIGIDGLAWNAKLCMSRNGIPCIIQDLEKGSVVIEGADLIWCSDVAEHIDEQYVDNFLTTVSACKVLAMCQGNEDSANQGWHHVNNKPESYWIERLASVGMIEDPALTAESRTIGTHGWWPLTGHIYRKRI